MSEIITICCDRCRERTDKAHRTRLKWARESECPGKSWDLCGECTDWLQAKLGLIPEPLPFVPPAAGPKRA